MVNGKEHLLNFTEAGKPWGCADQVCMCMHDVITICLPFQAIRCDSVSKIQLEEIVSR